RWHALPGARGSVPRSLVRRHDPYGEIVGQLCLLGKQEERRTHRVARDRIDTRWVTGVVPGHPEKTGPSWPVRLEPLTEVSIHVLHAGGEKRFDRAQHARDEPCREVRGRLSSRSCDLRNELVP